MTKEIKVGTRVKNVQGVRGFVLNILKRPWGPDHQVVVTRNHPLYDPGEVMEFHRLDLKPIVRMFAGDTREERIKAAQFPATGMQLTKHRWEYVKDGYGMTIPGQPSVCIKCGCIKGSEDDGTIVYRLDTYVHKIVAPKCDNRLIE